VIPGSTGKKSVFGMFAISVNKKSKAHEHGCCCPACSNAYEDMIGKAVRMTLAEAASQRLDSQLHQRVAPQHCPEDAAQAVKIIKPAIGYSSCPDHTLKADVLKLLEDNCEITHGSTECRCGHHHDHSHAETLGIQLTESYAMTPEASICGLIFMHPEARYPQIRRISQEQFDNYVKRRGMDAVTSRRFLGHLLK
jgi:5-methyltetrahydrofolate--homocysteine methyltransferase